jgi:hypothetical protein
MPSTEKAAAPAAPSSTPTIGSPWSGIKDSVYAGVARCVGAL